MNMCTYTYIALSRSARLIAPPKRCTHISYVSVGMYITCTNMYTYTCIAVSRSSRLIAPPKRCNEVIYRGNEVIYRGNEARLNDVYIYHV